MFRGVIWGSHQERSRYQLAAGASDDRSGNERQRDAS